jgi:hypothetical protein
MLSKSTINRYKLPVPKVLLKRIDRTSSPAHQGKLRNAIDFIVDEETPLLAAADGIVTFVKVSYMRMISYQYYFPKSKKVNYARFFTCIRTIISLPRL